jgi:hypothetical protein
MAVWALFRAVARAHTMCAAYGMEMKSDFWVVQLLLSELGVNLRVLFSCLFYGNLGFWVKVAWVIVRVLVRVACVTRAGIGQSCVCVEVKMMK